MKARSTARRINDADRLASQNDESVAGEDTDMRALRQWGSLLAGFLASFFAVGISYWSIPYSAVSLPDTLVDFGIIVVILASGSVRAWAAVPAWKTTLLIAASVPAAVIARVIVEATADPTSHNLWPIEVVIAAMVGFAAALAGALAGSLIAWLRAGSAQGGRP